MNADRHRTLGARAGGTGTADAARPRAAVRAAGDDAARGGAHAGGPDRDRAVPHRQPLPPAQRRSSSTCAGCAERASAAAGGDAAALRRRAAPVQRRADAVRPVLRADHASAASTTPAYGSRASTRWRRTRCSLPGAYFEQPQVVCYLARGPGAAIRRARTRLPGGGREPRGHRPRPAGADGRPRDRVLARPRGRPPGRRAARARGVAARVDPRASPGGPGGAARVGLLGALDLGDRRGLLVDREDRRRLDARPDRRREPAAPGSCSGSTPTTRTRCRGSACG